VAVAAASPGPIAMEETPPEPPMTEGQLQFVQNLMSPQVRAQMMSVFLESLSPSAFPSPTQAERDHPIPFSMAGVSTRAPQKKMKPLPQEETEMDDEGEMDNYATPPQEKEGTKEESEDEDL